jgi:hypothetical protein
VNRHLDTPVDLVKCDVEGGEMAVLRGSRSLRHADDPPMWMMEADERFLIETGSSYDEMEQEINTAPVAMTKYFVGPDGTWSVLSHLSDLRGTTRVNVVLVPKTKASLVAGLLPAAY